MKRVQLVGPMTGIALWNYPAFHEAATLLRGQGFDVFDPSETGGGDTSLPRSFYMRAAIGGLLHAECVVTLPGWETSPGAKTEVRVALALGIPVVSLSHFLYMSPLVEMGLRGGPDD